MISWFARRHAERVEAGVVHQLTLTERYLPRSVVVPAVSGELDIATAWELDDRPTDLTATGHRRLVLDVARLTFCDASGIRVLARVQARVCGQRGWLRLAGVVPPLSRILEILAPLTVLPAFDDVSRAVAGPVSVGAH